VCLCLGTLGGSLSGRRVGRGLCFFSGRGVPTSYSAGVAWASCRAGSEVELSMGEVRGEAVRRVLGAGECLEVAGCTRLCARRLGGLVEGYVGWGGRRACWEGGLVTMGRRAAE